mgnify:CR=1 FL=1
MNHSGTVSEIYLIAPSIMLARRARAIIAEMQADVQVIEASLEDAAQRARELLTQGAQVFISRTGTQALLEQELNATVVGIPTVLSDYMEIMDDARNANGPVAFFSYDEMTDEVRTMCSLLHIDARHYAFRTMADGEPCVQRALADGAVLGIGGAVTEEPARRAGLRYLPLESSAESIASAIQAALRVLRLKKQSQAEQQQLRLQLERYQAVFQFTHDGIVSIDQNGMIDLVNPVAQRILKRPGDTALGKYILDEIPKSYLWTALETGQAQMDTLLNIKGTMVYSNSIPIELGGKIHGVVATFQDVKSVQSSERKIRIGLHEKGLVAKYRFEDILGRSEAIVSAIQIAKSYAAAPSTVLITGETGTGKELFAQSIHNASPRSVAPFVAVNCATLDKNLLESELFGYVEGAFTGAAKGGKAGLFELAHTGTLFLDEIGEIPLELQAKLLRVLQEREIRRLGGGAVTPVDVRIVAATNRDLAQAVTEGTFRSDLFYRLNILSLQIAPLRARKGDPAILADAFFRQLIGGRYEELSPYFHRAMQQMEGYSWPGNIRELHNFVERVSVLMGNCESGQQVLPLLEELVQRNFQTGALEESKELSPKPEYCLPSEKERILKALEQNGMVMGRTAAALGISRTTLWRKLRQYGIEL